MRLTSYLAALRRAETADDAARVVFEEVVSPVSGSGRGVIWVRGVEGPRLLWLGGEPGQTVSMTVTRLVLDHDAPVLLDLHSGRVTVRGGAGPSVQRIDPRAQTSLMAFGQRWVLGLPLVQPGARVRGVLTLELEGDDRPPAGAWRQLQDGLDVAAPFLWGLPLRRQLESPPPFPVVGQAMGRILTRVERYARTDETILLSGPTGAGKTRLAGWIAEVSRRTGPFQAVHLYSQPADLVKSTLFGHRRGSFTGADEDRRGVLGAVQGGTLFIDEVDKLNLEAQAVLLRLLDEGTYRVLGSDRVVPADVRFIVGTNRNLEVLVERGDFRPDLRHRVDVLRVEIPGLSQRSDEIVSWFEHMMQAASGRLRPLSPGAAGVLCRHAWPGNLRELNSVVKRVVAGAADTAAAIEEDEIRDAIGAERRPDPLLEAMTVAAGCFVDRAEARGGLDLDHTRALRGMVLQVAAERHGVAGAYELLGRERTVAKNNHQRLFREQEALVARLRRVVADEAPR